MSDLLSVFDDKNDDDAEPTGVRPLPMTKGQRSEIRERLTRLDVSAAAFQLGATAELSGVRVSSAGELDAGIAHRLIGVW